MSAGQGQAQVFPEREEANDCWRKGMTNRLPINLGDLLSQRTIEGERVEYKAGWNPQSVLHYCLRVCQ